MGLFDSLTGSGQARTQKTIRGFYGNQYDRNNRALKGGYDSARTNRTNANNTAINTLRSGRDTATGIYRDGRDEAYSNIDAGADSAASNYGLARQAFTQAGDAFAPIESTADQYAPGRSLYIDSVGLNGDEGEERASEAYGNSLNSDFRLKQTLDRINRAAAARGGGTVSAGNIDRDATQFAADYIGSDIDRWQDRLLGLGDRGDAALRTSASARSNASNNIAGVYGQEAGLRERQGGNKAQYAFSTSDRIADAARGTSNSVAGLQSGLGTALANYDLDQAGSEIGLRNNYSQNFANSLVDERNARDQASSNALNLGVSALSNAAKFAGSFY